jgi:hypothetical protein
MDSLVYRPNAFKTSSVVRESLLLVLTSGRFLSRQSSRSLDSVVGLKPIGSADNRCRRHYKQRK